MSFGVTRPALGSAPMLSEAPMTCPPGMPAPAKEHGKDPRPVVAPRALVCERQIKEEENR